jgi:hypothetical protein
MYCTQNHVRVIKSRRGGLAEHVACTDVFINYMLCRSENMDGREDHFSQLNGERVVEQP